MKSGEIEVVKARFCINSAVKLGVSYYVKGDKQSISVNTKLNFKAHFWEHRK